MSDRRTPLKVTLLFAPLLLSVLTLHAWGAALTVGLSRVVGFWQYPERSHGSFRIHVPRRSDADVMAARTLDELVGHAVKTHGAGLGIRPPAKPVEVILFDADTDPRRFGWPVAETLAVNEGILDTERRRILVRIEQKLQQEPVMASLRREAARLLLHDAGSAGWSPWLAEGLVGPLEGSRAADLRSWTGDLPTVTELLTARTADFRGRNTATSSRGARLLAAYLSETRPEAFDYYYKAERAEGPAPQAVFEAKFGDLSKLEDAWKEWLKAQK